MQRNNFYILIQLDRANLATKEDIARLETGIERMGRLVIMWNVGTMIAVASLVFAIIRSTGGSAG